MTILWRRGVITLIIGDFCSGVNFWLRNQVITQFIYLFFHTYHLFAETRDCLGMYSDWLKSFIEEKELKKRYFSVFQFTGISCCFVVVLSKSGRGGAIRDVRKVKRRPEAGYDWQCPNSRVLRKARFNYSEMGRGWYDKNAWKKLNKLH